MPSNKQEALPRGSRGEREATFNERQLMAAIGVDSVEALDRHLDRLLEPEKRPGAERLPPREESHSASGEVPWWLIGAGFGVGAAISGVLLALSRRSNA